MFKRLFEMLLHPSHFYKVEELKIGGHCGCCGAWVAQCIVEKQWAVTLCDKCINIQTQERG